MDKTTTKNTPPKRAVLEDGTEVRLVPLQLTGHPLYMAKDGRAFNYKNGIFRHIKSTIRPMPKRLMRNFEKNTYLKMVRYKGIAVHRAVLEAWGFPRPEGFECDHINGNHFDNRLENLEWVTRGENARRRKEMYAKRGLNYNGKPLKNQSKLIQLTIQFD